MPRKLAVPGMVIVRRRRLDGQHPDLKGIHYAMHAGIYAAEAIVASLKEDPESVDFSAYDEQVRKSVIEKDLYQSRNVRQHGDKGFFLVRRDRQRLAAHPGRAAARPQDQEHDSEVEMTIGKAADCYPEPDNELTFNKLDSVFLSGNATRDDAPNHVRIQTHVPREVAQTWVSMCPAQVYEIPEDQLESGAAEVDVHVTASNCVQCGAITAKGGRLTMPEGGDGPLYQET